MTNIAEFKKPLELTTPAPKFDLTPTTFAEAIEFSKYLANSDFVPKNFRGKPGDCLIAMQWGSEIGLKCMQSLQNLSVINGKPGLYGDAGKAILLSAGCVIEEDDIEIIEREKKARCKITRPGRPTVERTYSVENAKTAGIWGKEGPWRTNPWRQMAWRAFWFAARDAASDLLKGMPGAEEIADTPRDMGPVTTVPTSEQGASDELVTNARHAAAQGKAAFAKFWNATPKEVRPQLRHIRAELDQTAADFDAARTVETTTPQPAATNTATGEVTVTFEQMIQRLDKATSEDGLYVAMDWSSAMDDQSRIGEVEAHFNARLEQVRK